MAKNVVLLRVGVDAGCGGIQGPLFEDGTFEFICIPDRKKVSVHTYGNMMGRTGKPFVGYFPQSRRKEMAAQTVHVELREITTKKGIALAEKLDPTHQQLINELSKLKGAAFDQAYTKDMVAGHEAAIKQFEIEIKTGRDPDVKAWAEKCLPTLREHLKLAQAAVEDVKKK